jgi:hypothetical protein
MFYVELANYDTNIKGFFNSNKLNVGHFWQCNLTYTSILLPVFAKKRLNSEFIQFKKTHFKNKKIKIRLFWVCPKNSPPQYFEAKTNKKNVGKGLTSFRRFCLY